MTYPNTASRLLQLVTLAGSLLPLVAQSPAQLTGVPAVLQPPAGNEEYLTAAATGTQNYLCMPSGWMFTGPQATLFFKMAHMRRQAATHFLSPNPDEEGRPPRATWQDSFDTSAVWAAAVATSSAYAEPGAIPWLLLKVVGKSKGPIGGSAMAETTYIQRVKTTGGVAPEGSCTVGARAFVPYTAEYVFFREARGAPTAP
jgi:hypothetical protein